MSASSITLAPHPSDKEIALLAFEHWKSEGCSHLRPEHWLHAERELMEAYEAQSQEFASSDFENTTAGWAEDEGIVSCFAHGPISNLAMKG